jgi:hypothetical protein
MKFSFVLFVLTSICYPLTYNAYVPYPTTVTYSSSHYRPEPVLFVHGMGGHPYSWGVNVVEPGVTPEILITEPMEWVKSALKTQ